MRMMIRNGMEDKGGGGEEAEWAELTQECLTNILSRLTLEERWRGPMLVCKSWLKASQDPSLNSVFDLDAHFDSPTESSRWWPPDFERKMDSMLRSVVVWSDGSLTHIRTRHCSDLPLNLAAQRCPNLQVLSIKSCPNVTDVSMTSIAYRCTKLTELDISYCYEISHESLAMIGRNCPNLKILKRNFMNWLDPSQHVGIVPDKYLNACPQDGDAEAAAVGKFMPHLEHLEIRFSKLSGRGLGSICEGCLNLEYLDLSGCANLTGRDIANATSNLKNVKDVKKPNFYIPRSVFHAERYGHWRLYDERFQTDVFRI
ncbi:LRR_1 domain-containing protein/LRR_6 domain-containing protein [Cephalotus follicularis]|uniref:LRR_1 domain-containing protein/LRR_6 domain-containing protein n=1 Tax=Cephalotus follicularis TaxID=3775 RepID=A0A1Q3CT10_CEPFO|nr:LRR_1 domain-containing protein/LRR_6 domain-containing protein [Cephalotus follicularis]